MSVVVGSAPRPLIEAGSYRALAEKVRSDSLLVRRPGLCGIRMALVGLALCAGWSGVFIMRGSWAVLGVAAFLAVVFVQVVFVGHDVGHRQVFGSWRANRLTGLVAGDLVTGLSFGWWVPKHNAHHAHPNQVDRDPDIGAGVVTFTAEIANRRTVLSRFLLRHQAGLFFPLLTLEAIALHVASIQTLARRRDRAAFVEGLLLATHAVTYLGLIFWLMPVTHAIAFMVVQQAVFGFYLGCSFAPSHKGMPILSYDSEESFLARQVMTSRNITGGRFTTLLLGGLNYQIEHHLFPTMPRRNLAKAQCIVQDFCVTHGLSYEQCGLISSYRLALSHLHRVGRSGSTEPAAP
jgi:fatty acid desaturase